MKKACAITVLTGNGITVKGHADEPSLEEMIETRINNIHELHHENDDVNEDLKDAKAVLQFLRDLKSKDSIGIILLDFI